MQFRGIARAPKFNPEPTEDYKRRLKIIRNACAHGKELKWVVPRAKKRITALYGYHHEHYRDLIRRREKLSDDFDLKTKHKDTDKSWLKQYEYRSVLKNATESIDLARELGPSAIRELQDFIFENHPVLEAARKLAKERYSSVWEFVSLTLHKAIGLTKQFGFEAPSDIIEEIAKSAAESEFRYYLELAVKHAKSGSVMAARHTLNRLGEESGRDLDYDYVERYPGKIREELIQEILSLAQTNQIIIDIQLLISKLEREDNTQFDLSTLRLLNGIKKDQSEFGTVVPIDWSDVDRRVLLMMLENLCTLGTHSLDLMENSEQDPEPLTAVAKAIDALVKSLNELRHVEL